MQTTKGGPDQSLRSDDSHAGIGPSLRDIYAARKRIMPVARRTPLDRSLWLTELTGHDVYLKLECWQRTKSFKMRGAYNAIASLDPQARARGLVTASAGNHGQAVALAARELGARAIIFVPATAPETKKARIRSFGAELRDEEPSYDVAQVAAQRFAQETGATFVHAFSDAAVVAGQGTVGIEIIEDLPHVRDVLVPVGGGGLIGGIGIALKSMSQELRVIGVQSTETPAMRLAFDAGHVTDCPIGPTLADGLAGCVDEISYERARLVVDEMHLVEESALPAAIRAMFKYDGIIAEGAASVCVAAIVERVVEVRGPTVLVITGGNIDAERFASILSSD
ncbi:MAG: threonine/serine dehydratase [Gemmatimonadota bacterium]